MSEQFEAIRTFGAEAPARNGRLGIAFDGNQLSAFVIHELPAANRTVWTYRARNFSAVMLGSKIVRSLAHRISAHSITGRQDLLHYRPTSDKACDLHDSLPVRLLSITSVLEPLGYRTAPLIHAIQGLPLNRPDDGFLLRNVLEHCHPDV